jgi:gentisate 1,2-dioxygenase
MPVTSGALFSYTKYREHFAHEEAKPAVWRWQELAEMLQAVGHTERGSLTLASGDTAGSCEILPGIAISTQVVKSGASTRSHAHAWWHLYFVQAGVGRALLGETLDATALSRGDLLLIPAWCGHRFENTGGVDDLVLMSMTNLPQQARLSNLLADEPTDRVMSLQKETA